MIKNLRKDISLEEISQFYKDCDHPKLKEKLLVIKMVYLDYKVIEIAKIIRVTYKTIYNWIALWNSEGIEGLKNKYDLRGRKKYLSNQEWQQILAEIETKNYTIAEVRNYVKKTRGVSYSYQGIWRILRKEFKLNYDNFYISKGNESNPDH
jgi:transposase